jgi:hypothetical protein
MADEQNEKESGAVDLSGIGSFDFTPDWAKGRSDDTSRYAHYEPREERKTPSRGDRPRFSGPRREGANRPEGGRPPRRDERGPRREARVFVKPLEADVRILPSQTDLGAIIRRIQGSFLAYPMRQLERLFFENPKACMLRVTLRPEAEGRVSFHQCKACGAVAFSEDELMAHIVTAHLADYWDAQEVACEPPKGAFTCVAKCGLSGEWLGPPNLHGYDARIREMLRTRYPNMSESAYRARIEMVRDAEAVETWRQSVTKKTVYTRKGDAEAPAVERDVAELTFRRSIAPSLMTSPNVLDVTVEQALKASDRSFVKTCRDAFEFEKRRPRNLSFALHGAFHHRKLTFFRANDAHGPEFVVAVKPAALDTAHAVPALVDLVNYVTEHPGVTRAEALAALAGGDAQKETEVKAHLSWLIEKGHLIGFSDGRLAVPAKFPRHDPPRAPKKQAAEPSREEPKESQEEPKEEVKNDETADQLAE